MLPLNGDDGFVEVPGIAHATLSFLESARIGRAKLQAPLPHRFVRDDDAAFSQQFLNFTKAEAESMVEPHGVTDDFGRKTMALVAGCFGFHHASLPNLS